jgi:hypothetical protein
MCRRLVGRPATLSSAPAEYVKRQSRQTPQIEQGARRGVIRSRLTPGFGSRLRQDRREYVAAYDGAVVEVAAALCGELFERARGGFEDLGGLAGA